MASYLGWGASSVLPSALFNSGYTLDAAKLNSALDPDKLAEQVLSRMYLHPVIVVCDFCGAVNAISNPTCVSCNGPMGNSKRKSF